MAIDTKGNKFFWTKDNYIQYLNQNPSNEKDASILWHIKGACMICGCPADNDHMKYSPSPYTCRSCAKKQYPNSYEQQQNNAAHVEDNLKTPEECFKYIKQVLAYAITPTPKI